MAHRVLLIVFSYFALLSPGNGQSLSDTTLPFPGHMIAPAELVTLLNAPSARWPLLLNVGSRDSLPGSTMIGPMTEAGAELHLKQLLRRTSRTRLVVLYCGCCPYAYCPNLTPAVDVLKRMKVPRYQVLDLPKDLTTDWTKKGYPLKLPQRH